MRAREFALAEGDYKKILEVEPENAEALNLLGYVYAFQGKVADAEATFARYSKQSRARSPIRSIRGAKYIS